MHIDVKHHLEKKEYYFELIDELASLKVNGIIIEFEDKLGYQKRPIVAAPDSYSISWWKSLSDYADKRNIKISPLIQGLGHASFILKHKKRQTVPPGTFTKIKISHRLLVQNTWEEVRSNLHQSYFQKSQFSLPFLNPL